MQQNARVVCTSLSEQQYSLFQIFHRFFTVMEVPGGGFLYDSGMLLL